jgi:hypothetical protein
VCFFTASFYMYLFLSHTDTFLSNLLDKAANGLMKKETVDLLIYGRLVSSRLALLSCGVLAGLSLGLVGFCLFLVGAKGEIEATGENQLAKLHLTRLAPGALVLFCSVVLIGVCVTHKVKFDTKITSDPPTMQTHLPAQKSYSPLVADQNP